LGHGDPMSWTKETWSDLLGGIMGKANKGLRLAAVGAVAALALAACGGGSSSSTSGGGEPAKGGTLYYLTNA